MLLISPIEQFRGTYVYHVVIVVATVLLNIKLLVCLLHTHNVVSFLFLESEIPIANWFIYRNFFKSAKIMQALFLCCKSMMTSFIATALLKRFILSIHYHWRHLIRRKSPSTSPRVNNVLIFESWWSSVISTSAYLVADYVLWCHQFLKFVLLVCLYQRILVQSWVNLILCGQSLNGVKRHIYSIWDSRSPRYFRSSHSECCVLPHHVVELLVPHLIMRSRTNYGGCICCSRRRRHALHRRHLVLAALCLLLLYICEVWTYLLRGIFACCIELEMVFEILRHNHNPPLARVWLVLITVKYTCVIWFFWGKWFCRGLLSSQSSCRFILSLMLLWLLVLQLLSI